MTTDKIIAIALAALALLAAVDHAMLVDQQAMCEADAAPCPERLWFWG